MSTSAAARRAVALRPAPAKARPRLVVLSPQRAVARTPFIVLIGALLLGGLLSLLMLHTLAAQDSFHQTSLQQKLAQLTDSEQRLEQQVQIDSAPAALRQRAKALGMVPSVVTSYHQRPNGRIVAHEVAATSVAAAPTAAPSPTTTSNNASSDNAGSKKASSASTSSGHPHHHGAAQQ